MVPDRAGFTAVRGPGAIKTRRPVSVTINIGYEHFSFVVIPYNN
jgi:hypothetical protein